MKTILKSLVLAVVCLLMAQPAFAAAELFEGISGLTPAQSLESSLSKKDQTPGAASAKATSADFLAQNSLSAPLPVIPKLNLEPKSIAISRADRASFKELLASKGINYITDADLDSLESNTPAADLDTRGYLLSISGKFVAIAFMGNRNTPSGYEAIAKTAVFKNKVKQYELTYPFISVFEGFQMAFTKDDRLSVAYNGQVIVESVKTDSLKRITERKTDQYDNSTGTPVFQYTRTVFFNPETNQKTRETFDYYFSSSDPVDRQRQTFLYDENGQITAFIQENYKNKKIVSRLVETREPYDCGQMDPCSRATSFTREDYSYYTNGRLKEIIVTESDPETNQMLKQTFIRFANNPWNSLTYYQENEGNKSVTAVFTYNAAGVIQKIAVSTVENGVLRLEEEYAFFRGKLKTKTIKTYDEFGNLIDTKVIHY